MNKYIFDDKNECVRYIKKKLGNFTKNVDEYFELMLVAYLNLELLNSEKLKNVIFNKVEELKTSAPLYYIILYNIMYKKDVDNLDFFNNVN